MHFLTFRKFQNHDFIKMQIEQILEERRVLSKSDSENNLKKFHYGLTYLTSQLNRIQFIAIIIL